MKKNINVLASSKNWNLVYKFLHDNLKNYNIEKQDITHILLASEEIFVNISNYAYGENKGKVDINFEYKDEKSTVVVKFTDKGVKFDPTKIKKADVRLPLNSRKIGGLGLFIVNKVMDKVKYEYKNKSNNLIITKVIKSKK